MRKKALLLVSLFFVSVLVPLVGTATAQEVEDVVILNSAVNPANNHTYYLLSESSWTVAAQVARGLDGFLVTVDDAEENQWVFDTFASWDNQSRHLWTGLADVDQDGTYKWHNGAPFYYRNWGADQPSETEYEGYVHIAGTNMGNIMPSTWNDLETDPQYFPVYGVVEVGPGADYSLRFADDGDRVEIPHDDHLNITESLVLSSWVYPFSNDGIQFITMKGDYGWGMYLNNGELAYASEYSLSQHPTSNQTIPVETWSHIEIEVIENVGGHFRINGAPAGTISAEDATIPAGDFGSNDCFTSGDDCDELFIASMGAGCECNYFHGMMDNLSVGTNLSFLGDEVTWVSNWTFAEGEGMETTDLNGQSVGEIFGADWVMPDGTIVAQAIELENGEQIEGISGQAGDNLLFFAELEPMTKELFFNLYPTEFKEEEIVIDLYFGHNRVPSSWDHDGSIEATWGYAWEQISWPDEGTWWVLLVPQTDIEGYEMVAEWTIADPPPSEEEMTQLINGIPVTGQTIDAGRQSDFDERMLYYYIDVQQNLSSLTVSTYGGTGNIDIGMSWGTVPDPFEFWFFEEIVSSESNNPNQGKIVYDSGQGNDHDATLYDVEPGRYYVTAFTYGRALDYTIVATMAFAPDNTEPEDAIELSPGIAYGPLTGYDGLNQYFKIDVPTGTERIEVDLDEGYGEATMYMRLEQFPTAGEFDVQSSSPGAGDKIGFNDPTPGTWYILLSTEDVFANVMITASFEDRYIWTYDGTPIELFNGEEINGLEAPANENLLFFVELENPGVYLEINTYGGLGSLELIGEGTLLMFEFDDFFPEEDKNEKTNGRQGPPGFGGFDSENVQVSSEGEGTEHTLYIEMPANGRFDITLYAEEAINDVSIIAMWEYSELPPVEEPGEPPIGEEISVDCEQEARDAFEEADADENGVVSEREFRMTSGEGDVMFSTLDLNEDGEIEYREALQYSCSCSIEMNMLASQLSPRSDGLNTKTFSDLEFKNNFDVKSMDTDKNNMIDVEEMEIEAIVCTTTFDAFDGDGDGVLDEDDAFPNDPSESQDTDGDGVGDNADLAPSVSNDLIYGSIGLIGAIVTFILVIAAFGSSRASNSRDEDWDNMKQQDLASKMLGLEPEAPVNASPPSQAEDLYGATSGQQPTSELMFAPSQQTGNATPSMEAFSDLLEPAASTTTAPSAQLMGMLDASGAEVLEYPAGGGTIWTRASPTDEWNQR